MKSIEQRLAWRRAFNPSLLERYGLEKDKIVKFFIILAVSAGFIWGLILMVQCGNESEIKHGKQIQACLRACNNDAVLSSYEYSCECGGRQGVYYMKPSANNLK